MYLCICTTYNACIYSILVHVEQCVFEAYQNDTSGVSSLNSIQYIGSTLDQKKKK